MYWWGGGDQPPAPSARGVHTISYCMTLRQLVQPCTVRWALERGGEVGGGGTGVGQDQVFSDDLELQSELWFGLGHLLP